MRPVSRITRVCLTCLITFKIMACQCERERGLYCSRICAGIGKRRKKTKEEMFLIVTSRIHVDENGCWIWLGAKKNGYGALTINGKPSQYAHRISYELFTGVPIPSDKELDHLCMVRPCINPDHLETVTHQENMLRGHAMRRSRNVANAESAQAS